MGDSEIGNSQKRLLSDQQRHDLLLLHEACKVAWKSEGPYPFDWLIDLLRAPTAVYAVDYHLHTASFTLYVSGDEYE